MRSVLASVLASVLVLAACGGSPAPPAARAPAAPAASAQPPAGGETPAEASTGAKARGPWGASVPDAEDEARAAAWLKGLQDGNATPVEVILIGPGLWSLLGKDPKLAALGIPVTARVTINGKQMMLDGRAIRNDEVASAYAHPFFVEMGRIFGGGAIAAATEKERALYYEEIAWEIAGQPMTVARSGDEHLLLHFSDDTIAIELLEAWLMLTRAPETQP
jgi:hypothetical protein